MQSQFSRIISGTMTWGQWGKNLSTNDMATRIEAIVGLGINSFDHADIYGGYTTEAEFGSAFLASGIPRESVQFISKCGIQYPSDARPLAVKHYDYSSDHIIQSVDNSLRHLQTDYLDLLLLHRPSPLLEPEEVTKTIQKLLNEGKILDFGVSNFDPAQMGLLQRELRISWNQIQCALTHPESMSNGLIDHCQSQGIGVMAWNPLGSYFKEPDRSEERLLPLLEELRHKYDSDADQLLLAWLLQHPAKIHPVVGTTEPDRLKKALEATAIQMDIQDWFRLYEASRGHRVA